MNNLIVNTNTVNSKEVAEMINERHDSVIRKIETISENLGKHNFVLSEYFTESTYRAGTRDYKCYEITRKGCEMIAHKTTGEKGIIFTAKYIEKFHSMEKQIQQITEKERLQLMLFSKDDLQIATAHKKLVAIEVAPYKKKIEEDSPLVYFANRIMKKGDNILVRELAKIITDEGFKIGQNKLYQILRDWKYIMKNKTEPTQRAMEREYFVVQTSTINTSYGNKQTFTTKVTPKGQIRIVERILKENKISIA